MNDQAKYTVTLEFETSGADAEINNLRKFQDTVDGVARQGGLTEKSQVKLSRAIHGTGQAAGEASSNLGRANNQIISLRYANYDLASSLLKTSAAITAVGAATIVSFAKQEAAFTEVERIAGGSPEAIQNLRSELQALSTEIPVAFGELSNIASLGAALDIPADDLESFTASVAKFAATTGVTVEAAATGFGKLAAYLQIPKEEFDALGSAILRAGNISVATEEQVLKFSQALALPGARIGFTTDQVVALGATLASFGNINVEGAGSALNRVTKNIERALSENGEDLQTWAATAGLSAEAFRVAWGSDVSGTFNRVIKGLSGDIQGLVGNLDSLGIRNVRDQRILEALALNYDKYNQILGETNSAWREGTYINEAYGLVLDDLVSKWQIFVNALTNFAATVGAQLAPAFAILLDLATKTLVALSDFADSPFGGFVVTAAGAIAVLVASWTALRGVIALATASTLALSFATQSLGGVGILAGLRALTAALFGLRSGAVGATAGVLTLRKAFRGLLALTGIGAVIAYVSELIFNTAETADYTADVLIAFANTVVRVVSSVTEGLGSFVQVLATLGANSAVSGIRTTAGWFRDLAKAAPKAKDGTEDFDKIIGQLNDSLSDLDNIAPSASNGIGSVGGAADRATQQIRTLVDYANDLSGVFSRSFDIRFGSGQGLDAIRSSFIAIREAADEAAKRIRDLRNDISSLTSGIDIQEYFLSIAIEYGDTQRAAAIEADLAKKRAELADKTAELQAQQDAASLTLQGTSKGAIENRKTILDLLTQYQSYIQALAASGVSQGQLAATSEQLRQDFLNQATALGFSASELQQYQVTFTDIARIISATPFAVTTDLSSLDPATLAIKEFVDQANANLNTLGSGVGGALGGFIPEAEIQADELGKRTAVAALSAFESRQRYAETVKEDLEKGKITSEQAANQLGIGIGGLVNSGAGAQLNNPSDGVQARVRGSLAINEATRGSSSNLGNQLASILRSGISGGLNLILGNNTSARAVARVLTGFESGGYTGQGGRSQPAGIVHKGEYVFRKDQVNQATGLPYADVLGRMMAGVPGYAGGGSVGRISGSSGISQMSLTPATIQAIAQAVQPHIILNDREIGRATSQAYAKSNTEGNY